MRIIEAQVIKMFVLIQIFEKKAVSLQALS